MIRSVSARGGHVDGRLRVGKKLAKYVRQVQRQAAKVQGVKTEIGFLRAGRAVWHMPMSTGLQG